MDTAARENIGRAVDSGVRILSIQEAAAYLGIGLRTAYDLARSGALPAVRIGRSWRVRLADLDALLTPGNGHGHGGATPSATPSHGPATPTPTPTPSQPLGDGHPHAPEPTPAQATTPAASVPADFIE